MSLHDTCMPDRAECIAQCNGRILEARSIPYKSGDFCSVRIQPTSSTATCRERSRTPRRLGTSEGTDEEQETAILLQGPIKRQTGGNNKDIDTPAAHARRRLPPPGNGPHPKTVSFEPFTTCDDGTDYYDWTIDNELMENMYRAITERGEQEQNEFLQKFSHSLRYGESSDDVLPTRRKIPKPAVAEDSTSFGQLVQKLRDKQTPCYALSAQWDAIPELHPNVWAALILNGTWSDAPVIKIHIYTDGSAIRQGDGEVQAAWAFVVLLEKSDGTYQFAGFNGQPMNHTARSHPTTSMQSSIRAEAAALLWAISWILTWQPSDIMLIEIHADNLAALYGLQGLWQLPSDREENISEIRQARFLMKYLQAQGVELKFTHSPAHRGIPGNEAADSICKAIAKQWIQIPDHRDDLIYDILDHPDLTWAWWNYSAQQGRIPHIDDIYAGPFEQPRIRAKLDQTVQVSKEVTAVNISVMTYNVQSLKDKEIGFGTRRELLSRQANEMKVDLLAVQETRYPCTILKSDPHYFMLTSKADRQGNYGVELWLRKTWGQKQEPMAQKHFYAVIAEPTLLKVALNHPNIQADVYVIYAPQQTASNRKIWWERLEGLLQQSKQAARDILILGDCNAKVGEVPTSNIGSYYAETTCPNGQSLQTCLENHQLLATNTFDMWSEGDMRTFGPHRLDYIIVPLAWQDRVRKVQTWRHIELLHKKEDHAPVLAELSWVAMTESHHAVQYDRKEAIRPENADKIEAIFQTFTPPSWQTHIDDHAQQLQDHVQNELCRIFPMIVKKGPTKPYLAEETWLRLQDRKAAKRSLHRLRQEATHLQLRRFFDAWKGNRDQSHNAYNRHVNNMQTALQTKQYDDILSQVRTAKQSDKHKFLRHQLEAVEEAIKIKDSRKLYQALRFFRPQNQKKRIKTAKVLPMLQNADQTASTHSEYCKVWEDYWATLECADILPLEELRRDEEPSGPPSHYSREMIPDLIDLERSVHLAKANKAPGPDNIPNEIMQRGGTPAAEVMMELLVKQAAQLTTPLQYQGGQAIPIYKKGDTSDPKSYRSIVLSNTFGKTLTKTWRTRLAFNFHQWTTAAQGGARRSLGTIAHITSMRIHSQLARQQNEGVSIILMDLQSAFYRAVRGQLIHWNMTDEEMARIFQTLQMPPAAFHDFCEIISEPAALEQAAVNPLHQGIVRSTFTKSWAHLPGSQRILHTSTGTRPGDPTADLLFSFIMRCMLSKVSEHLHETLPSEMKYQTYTWVDDIGIALRGPNHRLYKDTTRIISVLHDTATTFGMKPNLQRGKTDVMLRHHGYGKVNHQRDVDMQGDAIEIATRYSGNIIVHATDRLQYLGSCLDRDGKASPDIRRTTGIAYSMTRPLARQLLRNQHLPHQKRVQILGSLGLSHTSYSAGTWPELTIGEHRAWTQGVNRIYRLLVPSSQIHSISDAEIRLRYQLDHPDDMLRIERLRILKMLAAHADDEYLAPYYLQDELDHPYTWCWAIRRDYNMLREAAPALPTYETLHQLIHQLRKAECRRTFSRSLAYWQKQQKIMRNTEGHMLRLQSQFRHLFPQEPMSEAGHSCEICQASFSTRTALGVHKRQRHQQYTLASYYSPGVACLACGRGYHLRSRLVQHLQQGGTGCLQYLIAHVQPLSTIEVLGLNIKDREVHRNYRRTGQKSWAQHATFIEPDEVEDHDIYGQWDGHMLHELPDSIKEEFEMMNQAATDEMANGGFDEAYNHYNIAEGDIPYDLFDYLTDYMEKHPHPVLCRHLMQEARTLMSTVDMNASQLRALQDWEHQTYEWLRRDLPAAPTSLLPQGPATKRQPALSLPAHLMQYDETFGTMVNHIPQIGRPLATAPIRFCLLLFSGTRRPHDIAWHLENMQQKVGWTTVPVLLDLGVNEEHGDLMSESVRDLWLHAMKEGLVAYIHLAPPCETWSIARENVEGRVNDRPRPLRSRLHLFGIINRDLRELRQAMTGNALLLTAWFFIICAVAFEIAWSLEHPAGRESSASIWHLRFFKQLRARGMCELYTFLQGALGAVSAKPTTFAVGGGSSVKFFIQERIKQWHRPITRNALVGREKATGLWKTHRAKQYPSLLCWSIAASAIVAGGPPLHPADSTKASLIGSAPLAFRSVLSALWPDEYATKIAPDYHGWEASPHASLGTSHRDFRQ